MKSEYQKMPFQNKSAIVADIFIFFDIRFAAGQLHLSHYGWEFNAQQQPWILEQRKHRTTSFYIVVHDIPLYAWIYNQYFKDHMM